MGTDCEKGSILNNYFVLFVKIDKSRGMDYNNRHNKGKYSDIVNKLKEKYEHCRRVKSEAGEQQIKPWVEFYVEE